VWQRARDRITTRFPHQGGSAESRQRRYRGNGEGYRGENMYFHHNAHNRAKGMLVQADGPLASPTPGTGTPCPIAVVRMPPTTSDNMKTRTMPPISVAHGGSS